MSWGVREVTLRFGERTALAAVSLDVEPGTVTAVVGGDGAGKSTLLRVLAGLIRPETGSVSRPPAHRLGYFGAASGSYPDLTVAENVAFAATAYRAHDTQREAELLAAAGLADVTDRLAGHLSGGMRQKLGLVLALLHRPALVILDEPSTGVDPVSRTELAGLIARAAAAGAAVVLSTVYLDEAERANTVLVLDRGRALRAGAPEQIVDAVPGQVLARATPPGTPLSWRRGSGWREWQPPGGPVRDGGEPAHTDLEDAVIVAMLQRELP